MALAIAERFGWTLGEVFSLTFPQFVYVAQNIRRMAYRRALDEVYFGVCAAFGNEDVRRNLRLSAGSFCKEEEVLQSFSEEDLKAAEERMARIMEEQKDGD